MFGEQGHPVRATVSDMGPLLLGRMLDLNETQAGVLNLVFKIADDNGLLLLDLKDLRAMLQHVGENASQFTTEYGNISAASVGAIQRGLLQIESQGGDKFFGEPMLNISDFMQTDERQGRDQHPGRRQADELAAALRHLPACGCCRSCSSSCPRSATPTQPKLVFFFDEAHLLFNEAPKALVERIELVVRLVRSKGVGVFFVTQNPLDIPDTVLAQLGNRVQHALRAFTPRDQKAVKATATTMRQKPGLDIETAITELAVGRSAGELSRREGPAQRHRARVRAAAGQPDRADHACTAPGADRELAGRRRVREGGRPRIGLREAEGPRRDGAGRAAGQGQAWRSRQQKNQAALMGGLNEILFGSTGPRGGKRDGLAQTMAKSAVRTMGTTVGKEILRGVLGGIFGAKTRRR